MIRRVNKVHRPIIMKNDECDQILPPSHLRILKRAMKQNVRKKGRLPTTLLNTLTNDLKSMNLTFEQIAEMDKSEYID